MSEPSSQRPSKSSGSSANLSRRSVIGGAAGASFALAGLNRTKASPATGLTATEAARRQGTPAAEVRPSLHTYPLVQEKKTFRVLVPHYGINWAENAFTKWYEDRTNVHIEWVVVEDDIAVTQLNLQLSSGDYPDIIMGFNWSPFELTSTVVAAYGGQGIFVPLNDHLANNAPNLQQYVIPEYPIAQKITTMPGGEIFSMPYINDCFHCHYNTQKMWMNTAWLSKLGLEMPQTTDAFEQVLLAFKGNDPNGNGQPDEVPLTAPPGWSLDRFLMNPFQLSPGNPWLFRKDGKVAASYLEEGWRDGVAYLSRLSQQQLLAVEAFTQNSDQVRQLGDNGRIGVAPGVVAGSFITATEGTPGLWSEYQIMPALEGPTGLRQAFQDFDESHIPNVFVVTNKCTDPALAVAWADGLYEWEATIRSIIGVPGKQWRLAEEGELGIDGEQARWAAIPQPEIQGETGDQTNSWSQLSPSYRNSKDRLSQAVVGERSANTEVILYEGCKNNLDPYSITEDQDLLRPIFTADEAVRVSDLGTVIGDFVSEQFAQGATGQIDFEANWQAFQDQLKALGVEEYLNIHQQAHDRANQS
jgi:putative aldouronate transport system substrate-binding protein